MIRGWDFCVPELGYEAASCSTVAGAVMGTTTQVTVLGDAMQQCACWGLAAVMISRLGVNVRWVSVYEESSCRGHGVDFQGGLIWRVCLLSLIT
jgi:hypothetical protein